MLLPCHGNPRVGDVAPAFARCESRASWVEKNRGDIWRHGRNWKNSAWYVESWSKATQVKLSDFWCSKKEELRSNWPIWQNVMTAIILQYTAMITIWLQYIIAMVQYNCSNQGLIHWHRIISRLILNVLILKGLVSFVKVEHLDQSLLIATCFFRLQVSLIAKFWLPNVFGKLGWLLLACTRPILADNADSDVLGHDTDDDTEEQLKNSWRTVIWVFDIFWHLWLWDHFDVFGISSFYVIFAYVCIVQPLQWRTLPNLSPPSDRFLGWHLRQWFGGSVWYALILC